MIEAVSDSLQYADLADAWPVSLELEEVEADEGWEEPRVAHG
jgi:hypothetical protein